MTYSEIIVLLSKSGYLLGRDDEFLCELLDAPNRAWKNTCVPKLFLI